MSQSLLDECRDGIISEVKSKIKDGSMNEANSDGSTPLYIASSNSNLVRQNASSGGIIRSLLIELIKSKKADYVCILDEKEKKILNFDILVTKSIEKILNTSQSIYQTTPLLHKLKELKPNKRYVFVGLRL